MKKTLFTLILLAISASLFGKQYYFFNKYTTSDGLPSNTITSIVQDHDGFIWIGTRDGVCRYDGKSFLPVGMTEGHNAMRGRICSLTIDDEGLLWFSSTTGTGCYNPYTEQIMSLDIGEEYLNSVDNDKDGNIWFSTGDIIKYNKKSGELTKYSRDKYFHAGQVAVDSYGSVWFTSQEGSLYRYDQLNNVFTKEIDGKFERIVSISKGRFLVSSTDAEVYVLDPNKGEHYPIFNSSRDWDGGHILCMIERVNGEFWIGTETGIIVYDESINGIYSSIVESNYDSHAISASYVTCLGKDNENNIWTGSFYKGVNLWQNKNNAYAIYYPNPSETSISGQIIRSIVADAGDILWIGTEDGFLDEFDVKTKNVVNHPLLNKNLNIQDVMLHDGNIWVSMYGDGIAVYNPKSRKIIKRYQFDGTKTNRQLKTIKGEILVGTEIGLFKFNPSTDSFSLIECTVGSFVHAVANDSQGNIWIGTYGNGLFLFDKDLNMLAHVLKDGNDTSLSSNFITHLYEDARGRMWVCTEDGLCMTDDWKTSKKMTFTSLSMEDGLPSNITCAVAEDKDGYLWISTIKGLTQMNPDTYSFTDAYFKGSQITGNQYSYGATYTAPNGTIYMGTTDGMMSVNPSVLKADLATKKIFIDEIASVSASSLVHFNEPGHSARTSHSVKIKDKDLSTLRIHFSVPSYSGILETTYHYSLKGGAKEISERTADNSVSFTNLRPGHYTFTVSIVGSDSADSSRSLDIDIIPPFWMSRAASIFYLLLFIGIIAGIIYLIDAQRKKNQAREMRELVHQTQKEVSDAKINFFTNLTHEIRTPLTLIKMPLDKIIKAKEYLPECEKDMLTIQANTARLLTLTNELLDIQKMEKDEQKLSFTRQDICKSLRETLKRYSSIIEDRDIKVNLSINEEPIEMMFAKDSVDKIFNNLISNAIKYGKNIINISLGKDQEKVIFSIESNGDIISDADRDKIFEKFYSGGKGTGLGLALSKKLAELHKGNLYLDKNVTDMNKFVLELPLEHPEQVEFKKIVPEKEPVKEEIKEDFDSARHSVLIVDDEVEFRDYLSRDLSDKYNTYVAKNGVDALEILQKEKIDLVVSDIMMPEMDGIELCNSIKGTTEYSHVPVILLTAAVGMETRMETLEVGADGYIEKPFPIELLKANIANLFKNREISYHQFANSPLTHYNSITASRVDEEFMDKLHSAIMKHMAEQDLSIETLTNIMSTSKSTLYRKVKANTGLNINEYIRLCRLKQAAEMLSSQKYKVNEVGYLVGFSSPSYFATCFQKQFNISPSAFVKKIKE